MLLFELHYLIPHIRRGRRKGGERRRGQGGGGGGGNGEGGDISQGNGGVGEGRRVRGRRHTCPHHGARSPDAAASQRLAAPGRLARSKGRDRLGDASRRNAAQAHRRPITTATNCARHIKNTLSITTRCLLCLPVFGRHSRSCEQARLFQSIALLMGTADGGPSRPLQAPLQVLDHTSRR
jgi:hypothetical protein